MVEYFNIDKDDLIFSFSTLPQKTIFQNFGTFFKLSFENIEKLPNFIHNDKSSFFINLTIYST